MTFLEERRSSPGLPVTVLEPDQKPVSFLRVTDLPLKRGLVQPVSRACPTLHSSAPSTCGEGRRAHWSLNEATEKWPRQEVSSDGRGTSGSDAVTRWNREWDAWCADPDGLIAVTRWCRRYRSLFGLVSLPEVLAACGEDRSIPQEVADGRLAAVVAEARAGDRFAARVALHRVFPALVHRAAARAWSDQRPLGAVLEDLMASAWLVIADFPLERRPAKIAVNVVRDAENRIYGYVPMIVRSTAPVSVEDLPDGILARSRSGPRPVGDPQESLALLSPLLDQAMAAGFSVADARLLVQLFLSDLSIDEIARQEGVTPRRIRMRRREALDRLAALIGSDPRVVRGRNASSDVMSDVCVRRRAATSHG